jgi:hypothetical protein
MSGYYFKDVSGGPLMKIPLNVDSDTDLDL